MAAWARGNTRAEIFDAFKQKSVNTKAAYTIADMLSRETGPTDTDPNSTQINQAYGCFNQTSDGDLIESYVFEINALQARYNYLLRRLKQLGAQP